MREESDMKSALESKRPNQDGKGAKATGNAKSIGNFLLSVLLIVVALLSGARCVRQQYESELDAAYESMANAMYAVRNLVSFENSLQESYEGFDMQEAQIFTQVAARYFEYLGVSERTLTDYAVEMKDCAIYYDRNDGSLITSENADEFPLEKTQTRMLKTLGALETDDYDYTAIRVGEGWLYIRWDDAENLYSVDFQKIMDTCPKALCVIHNQTGEILASSDETPYDFLDESRVTVDEVRNAHEADGIQAGFFDGNSLFSGVYFEKIRLFNEYSIFIYTPLRSVLADILQKIAPEYGLMALCFLFLWIIALRMRKQGASIRDADRRLALGKRRYVNLSVARHAAPLLMVGVILITVISGYLLVLTSYATHNEKMSKNLSGLVNEMQLSDEEWGKMEKIFRELVTDRVAMIAEFMSIMGEDFDRDTLADLTRRLDLVSATVYDGDGVAVMSTDNYVGYPLSQNPDDDEYILWNLLNNADISLMRKFSDESGFFAAVRRTDAPGLICVTLTDNALRDMEAQTNAGAALLRVNTDTYAKMYASAEKPDTLLWATASATKTRSITNNLSESALMDGYFGTQTINGYEYYLNSVTDGDHILISVERNETLAASAWDILPSLFLESLLISAAVLLSACLYETGGGEIAEKPKKRLLARLFLTDKDSAPPEEREMDMILKRGCVSLLKRLFVALIVLYLANWIFSAIPLESYLFSHQWERRPGIFSLTTILLSVAFALIGLVVLKKTVKTLSGSLDSRAETIGDLTVSVINFAVWVAVAIYCLYQLGVNTSVLLTSAGVLSLIIGYGSQSLVSDLVSGAFLIFEDQIRIGEMVEIDGFCGNVTRIGLRTTTLEYFNQRKIVNNSKMVGFFNLSRDTSAARWLISVPVGVDVERVKALILNNKERFQEACGGRVVAGPIYVGMHKIYTDYFDAHYTLHFLTVCDVQNWVPVRTRSLEAAYKILTENGIKVTGGQLIA